MIDFALRRASNVHWQALEVNRERRARCRSSSSRAASGSPGCRDPGKSTIANRLEQRLFAAGRHTYLLDGDNVRHGLNRDLGFTEADRAENIRRVAEVARLMVDAGLIVLVAFISPFRAERRGRARAVRARASSSRCSSTRRSTSASGAIRRASTRRLDGGALPNFTGIDSPYEPPEHPELHVRTTGPDRGRLRRADPGRRVLTMDPMRVAAGALTGFVVGMTGVGGGALMTPILLLVFGTAPLTAVGHRSVVCRHHQDRGDRPAPALEGLIDWPVVARLWTGQPADVPPDRGLDCESADRRGDVTVRGAIGVAIVLSALSLLFLVRLGSTFTPFTGSSLSQHGRGTWPWESPLTVATGIAARRAGDADLGRRRRAGRRVSLPPLPDAAHAATRLVATDIAHAIPLALLRGHRAPGHSATSTARCSAICWLGSIPRPWPARCCRIARAARVLRRVIWVWSCWSSGY